MAKPSLKAEWKLWAAVGIIFVALALYLYLASRPPTEGGEYLWRVTKVLGDKQLQLRGSGQTVEFTLIGLEVPESQAQAAKDMLEKTLLDQWVRVRDLRDDAKGVKEGFVYLSGEDIHARMIRQGLASVDTKESRFDVRPYMELEIEAKREKKGMWGTPSPGAK